MLSAWLELIRCLYPEGFSESHKQESSVLMTSQSVGDRNQVWRKANANYRKQKCSKRRRYSFWEVKKNSPKPTQALLMSLWLSEHWRFLLNTILFLFGELEGEGWRTAIFICAKLSFLWMGSEWAGPLQINSDCALCRTMTACVKGTTRGALRDIFWGLQLTVKGAKASDCWVLQGL